MFHPYLLGDVPRNPPSNKTASSLRSLLGRSILAGEMVYENHQYDFQIQKCASISFSDYDNTLLRWKLSCFAQLEILLRQQAPFGGFPSHASKLQYRDANDQKNLRDQKESDDDSDDSNDSDSDDSDVDCNYTDDDWHNIPAYVSLAMQLSDPMISIGLHSQPWWLSIW